MSKERLNLMLDQKIAASILDLRHNILAAEALYHREPNSVTLLGVSKGQSADKIRAAYHAGIKNFGESYINEFIQKQESLIDLPVIWHFIGPVQSNKIKIIARHFSWAHSLDNIAHAQKLSQNRMDSQPPLNLCIQVNLDQEPNKSGLNSEDLPGFMQQLEGLTGIRLRGLMCLPKPEIDPDQQYQSFMRLTEIFNQINTGRTIKLDTLSMGMTLDYTQAIRAGSTLIRIGRGLFNAYPSA